MNNSIIFLVAFLVGYTVVFLVAYMTFSILLLLGKLIFPFGTERKYEQHGESDAANELKLKW